MRAVLLAVLPAPASGFLGLRCKSGQGLDAARSSGPGPVTPAAPSGDEAWDAGAAVEALGLAGTLVARVVHARDDATVAAPRMGNGAAQLAVVFPPPGTVPGHAQAESGGIVGVR